MSVITDQMTAQEGLGALQAFFASEFLNERVVQVLEKPEIIKESQKFFPYQSVISQYNGLKTGEYRIFEKL